MSSLEKNGKRAKKRRGAITRDTLVPFAKQSIQLKTNRLRKQVQSSRIIQSDVAHQSFLKSFFQTAENVGLHNPTARKGDFTSLFKITLCSFFIFLFLPFAQSQVQFKVELLSDDVTYRVSMLPSVTWNFPDNITSTAQVTVKVPTGGFSISNVTSLVPSTFWSANAEYLSPIESPNFDYFSVGLASLGTAAFTFQDGTEVPLFTFVNDGACTGPVEIMENNDPFIEPNSANANVSCQITTLGGGGMTNAFSGPYEIGSANCATDLNCLAQYQIDQLANGSYAISMVVDTAWNPPLNVTEKMLITVVAPTGTLTIEDFQSIQPNVNFEHKATYPAPPENPNSDYFVFELTDSGTPDLSYQRNFVVPLFSFKNGGNCSGDSLALMNNVDDLFAVPNSLNVQVGQFLKTAGSVVTLEPCPKIQKMPLSSKITNVYASNLSNCGADNGILEIETDGILSLEYSIDGGATWSINPTFTLLPVGSYDIQVRYLNGGCVTEYDHNPMVITQPDAPIITNITSSNPTGCNASDGSIEFTVSSIIQPEYSIDNGQTWQASNVFNNLSEGNYSVVVRNENMTCPISGGVVLLEFSDVSAPPIDSISVTNLTTCSALNGTLQFHTSESFDIEYSIDNGQNWQSNPHFTNLGPEPYFLQARNDATKCVTVYGNNPVELDRPDCNDCFAEYILELLGDGRYQVSVLSHVDWTYPQSITNTAQVTIVVPTGSFDIIDLTNLIPGLIFNDNSRQNSPPENPDFDYISFGLESLGTDLIPYHDGVKVPLFTFKNLSACTGPEIRLMNTDNDPFTFPNSQLINVGQQLTTVGSGQDGTVCIQMPGIAPCIPKVNAVNDTIYVLKNTTVLYNVLDNDTSYLGNPILADTVSGSSTANGTFTLNPDGTFTYTPNQDFTGTDGLEYMVCEDTNPGSCDIGEIILIVSDVSGLEAVDDEFQTTVNTPISGTIIQNDLNFTNDDLITELAVMPLNGSLNVNSNGTFDYTPNPGFVGFDFFLYKVCNDGFPIICDYATVEIEVTGSSNILAIDDMYFGMINQPVLGNIILNDYNPNAVGLSLTLLPGSNVSDGVLDLNIDGNFEYTPDTDFTGTDGFEYVVCETPTGICDTATVIFDISAELMTNDDGYDLDVNTMINDNVTLNDLIPNGANFVTMIVQNVGNGNLTLSSAGHFTYEPNIGFVGLDDFIYQICNTGSPLICDTATVTLNVISEIIADDDHFDLSINTLLSESVLPNDDFPNGVTVTTSLIQGVSNGDILFNHDGDFAYSPDIGFSGSDSFIYQICDNGIPQTCDTATVFLTVVPNLTANDDSYFVELNGGIMDDVSENDFLPNGIDFVTTLVDGANDGILIFSGDGEFIYMPDPGFIGTDEFTYQICDDKMPPLCDTATVILTITEKIGATDDDFEANINNPLTETVVTNDTFPNGNPITVNLLNDVNAGTLVLNDDGTFTYTPNFNFVGIDQFEYEICLNGQCSPAVVTLSVTAKILAIDDFKEIETGMPSSGDVTDNDIFGAGAGIVTATLVPTGLPNNGTVLLNPDGTYTYTPNSNFIGTDVFEYEICNDDNPPLCDRATVVLLVTPNVIMAINDTLQTPMNTPIGWDLVYNDFLPGNGSLVLAGTPVTPPNHGSVILQSTGEMIYLPDTDFVGLDIFQYRVCSSIDPSECDTAIVFVTVFGLQKPEIICPDEVCENENIILSLEQTYANTVTYEWINGNGDLVGTDAGLTLAVTDPNAISPFRIRVSENGLTTDYSAPCSIEIVTMPDVYATNSGPFCADIPVQLFATQIDNATYEWRVFGNSDVISVTQNPVLNNINQNTTYEVTVRLTECGLTATATTTVEILETPTLNPEYSYSMGIDCEPADLQFTANATGTGLIYSWKKASPNGIFSEFSSLENPVIPFANSDFNGNYSLTVTNVFGCSAEAHFVINDIVDGLNQPIITSTGPVCEGDEIVLTTQLYSGLSVKYVWTHDNAIMIGNSSNQLILQPVDSSTTGMYQVYVQVDDCETSSDTFMVEILESPQLNLTYELDDPCGGGTLKLLPNAIDAGNLPTYNWILPNGTISTADSLIINNTNASHSGTYSVTVQNENGCEDTQSVFVDSIYSKPNTPVLESSNNGLCTGETLELNADLYNAQSVTYEWHFDDGNSNILLGVTAAPTFFIPNVDASNSGIYSVFAVVDGCKSDISNLENITVLGAGATVSAVNSTDSANPACEGEPVELNVPDIPGATYNWTGPFGFDSDLPNPVLLNVTMNQAGGYFVTIEKDGCYIQSDTTEVMVMAQPDIPDLSTENEICLGDSVILNVTNPQSGATYLFYHGNTVIDSTNNPYTILYNVSGANAGQYYVLTSVNGCSSEHSNYENIEIHTPPNNVAYAGPDTTFCEEISIIELNATPPSVGTGLWTSPTGATVFNPNDPRSEVENLQPGENIFVWTLSTNTCKNYSPDSLLITLATVPDETAFAGADIDFCSQGTPFSLALNATQPGNADGIWTQTETQNDLGVSILNSGHPQTLINGLEPDQTYTFTWNLSTDECPNFSSDEVIVRVSEAPNQSAFIEMPEMNPMCGELNFNLDADPPAIGSGTWSTLSGATIINPSAASTTVQNLDLGENVMIWSLTHEACADYSSDTIVIFNEDLDANDDNFGAFTDDTMFFNLVQNDSLNVADWEIKLITNPLKGTVEIDSNGIVRYTTFPGSGGTDEFIYLLCSTSCPTLCRQATVHITIIGNDPSKIFVPNTISPNGDGINDELNIPSAFEFPNSELTVFNRRGNEVYFSENYQNDWQGTFNGDPLPTGTYYYCFVLNNQEKTVRWGYVTIRRN